MPENKQQNADWRSEKRHREGSIKTINGVIYARIQYIDEITGKRKEKLRRAPNRTKARELIKEMRRELEQGGQAALESDKLTFRQIAEKFEKTQIVDAVIQNGIKVAGKRSTKPLKSAIKPLKEFFGKKSIRRIKPSDLEAYKIERLNTPVEIEFNRKTKTLNEKTGRMKNTIVKAKKSRPRKIATVNRELALLRQIFIYAENENLITFNPFAKTNKLISTAAEVERDRVLSANEEIALLTACENDFRQHLKPLIITALDTAARRGELLKLQWKDVDLTAGVITIQATNAKTQKMRLIGMTSRVKAELVRLWEFSLKDKNALVFGIKSDFKRAWNSALSEAGISDLHFHDLRHTGITRMIRAGVPASEAMKISGHTQIKTFQKYVNLTNESVCVSANLLDGFLNRQQSEDSELIN